jgi:hypothetical protein
MGRLRNEMSLLYYGERVHKLPASPVIRQLIADAERPLPDALPPQTPCVEFRWPADTLDFIADWKRKDRGW